MNENGNSPAIPVQGNCVDASGAYCGDVVYAKGLTKRELFAAMAMQGLCARNDGELSHNRAAYAVEHADDLLAALDKSK